MNILNRIFQLFIQSFKYLFREKSTFIISSLTISLCLVLVSLVSVVSFYSVKKMLSMDSHKILVTFKKDIEDSCKVKCDAEIDKMIEIDRCPTCPAYKPSKLVILSSDTELEKKGKNSCKECIDNEYNKGDKVPSNLIEGRKMYKFTCDDSCVAPKNSKYPSYYGAKVKNLCMECMNDKCDQSIDSILANNGNLISLVLPRYKDLELQNFEKLFDKSYFNSYRGKIIKLPMRAEFSLKEEIDDNNKLNKLINRIWSVKDSNGYKIVESVEMFDKAKFAYYKNLIPMIIGLALVVIIFAILILFFIVSNTIRLIIHSKRHVLSTLRLLGERDFFIKLPFIFQGIWQGFIGAVISVLCMFILDLIEFNVGIYSFINKTFLVDSTFSTLSNIEFSFMEQPLILFFIIGILLGVFGSVRSCSKYLE